MSTNILEQELWLVALLAACGRADEELFWRFLEDVTTGGEEQHRFHCKRNANLVRKVRRETCEKQVSRV
jgi:hypothetical protein